MKNESSNLVTPSPWIFVRDEGLSVALLNLLGDRFGASKSCIVVVASNEGPEGFSFPKDLNSARRILIVFAGRPIDLGAMESWRKWATRKPVLLDLRMDFAEGSPTAEKVVAVVDRKCADWFLPVPEPESHGIEIREWVKMPVKKKAKDDPSLLTMMFGSMGELLTGLELAARRFRSAVGAVGDSTIANYHKAIDSLLAQGGSQHVENKVSSKLPKPVDLGIGNVTDELPKILLLGETGVGKTLIAGYLHECCGLKERPLHISIPEYLGKEDMFEYTLFGYAAGNYTGGKPTGDRGLLLENVCRVVFLDEIGEANAAIQAKLLTFLDHFNVRPRGWLGEPFYSPVLVVAATNRDLQETVNGEPRFRRDLLARFTDHLRIPALRDRKQDFGFILDCLLQRESMNPGAFVTNIGSEAESALNAMEFKAGNFRELEDLFRVACKKAHRDDRRYLVRSDFD
jgi:hypothetical protein